ncbi:unnamed protein product [Echinostoma caproni]|uniref:Uncharacterized protein n=1 Tax=Echinostoma caproni TaxID=27848 RepID=A0A3P8G9V4_9TREM|nr:unnamed protein product [Echinostoma caproni]
MPDDSLQRAMQQFIQPNNENEPGATGEQTLGLAAERLAASLRRVLDHIDPRRAWNTTATDGTEQQQQQAHEEPPQES